MIRSRLAEEEIEKKKLKVRSASVDVLFGSDSKMP